MDCAWWYYIGTEDGLAGQAQYVNIQVHEWIDDVNALAKIAKTEPLCCLGEWYVLDLGVKSLHEGSYFTA